MNISALTKTIGKRSRNIRYFTDTDSLGEKWGYYMSDHFLCRFPHQIPPKLTVKIMATFTTTSQEAALLNGIEGHVTNSMRSHLTDMFAPEYPDTTYTKLKLEMSDSTGIADIYHDGKEYRFYNTTYTDIMDDAVKRGCREGVLRLTDEHENSIIIMPIKPRNIPEYLKEVTP